MSKTKSLDAFVSRRFQQTGVDTLYLYYRKKKWREAKACIRSFLGKDLPEKTVRWHLRQMRHAYICYGWGFDEYFMFDFNHLSHAGRKEFVPNIQKDYFCDTVNNEYVVDLFTDKWIAYQHFAKYYRRDACQLQEWERDHEAAERFIGQHDAMIIKPTDWSFGDGIQIIRNATADQLKELLQKFTEGFVMEELIQQGREMAVLHPQSVNTVRITTLRVGDKTHIIYPFFKVGRGEDIVDNAAQGGIFGVIDIDTGVVTSACDKHGNRYICHPESGAQLVGFEVPKWNEAIALARELSTVVPEALYTGWDLAYTDDGWVVVEGNARGQFICFQTAEQKGFRKDLETMIGCTLKEFCKRK